MASARSPQASKAEEAATYDMASENRGSPEKPAASAATYDMASGDVSDESAAVALQAVLDYLFL